MEKKRKEKKYNKTERCHEKTTEPQAVVWSLPTRHTGCERWILVDLFGRCCTVITKQQEESFRTQQPILEHTDPAVRSKLLPVDWQLNVRAFSYHCSRAGLTVHGLLAHPSSWWELSTTRQCFTNRVQRLSRNSSRKGEMMWKTPWNRNFTESSESVRQKA